MDCTHREAGIRQQDDPRLGVDHLPVIQMSRRLTVLVAAVSTVWCLGTLVFVLAWSATKGQVFAGPYAGLFAGDQLRYLAWIREAGLHALVADPYRAIDVRRTNFLPRAGSEDEPFHQRLCVRERASRNLVGAQLEPKVAHRGRLEVVVAPGNHFVSGPALNPAPPSETLEILHFPMRSPPQFEGKVMATGIGYESLPFRSAEVGRDQLTLLELQRSGRLRDYYDRHLLCDDQIATRLESGELVIDRRLADFMAQLEARAPAGPPSPTH